MANVTVSLSEAGLGYRTKSSFCPAGILSVPTILFRLVLTTDSAWYTSFVLLFCIKAIISMPEVLGIPVICHDLSERVYESFAAQVVLREIPAASGRNFLKMLI